jgi:hypothetical protein
MKNRDDFTPSTKTKLAKRVGYVCSNPDCRRLTIGPEQSGGGSVKIGVGAHISAAAPGPGAKRYDPFLTAEQRKHESNGIHLCQNCAHLIDSDEGHYTVMLLQDWKRVAEERALSEITGLPAPLRHRQA